MFISRCKALPNKPIIANFPNLLTQRQIPSEVAIYEGTGDSPALDIQCRVTCGGSDLIMVGESYFNGSNKISLAEYAQALCKSGELQVQILNKTKDIKNIVIKLSYAQTDGNILCTNKYDHFEQVLTDVFNSGVCMRLVLSFNRKVKQLQLRPTVECVGADSENWISGLEIDVDSATSPNGRPTYTIDFTDDLALFSKYLNFLQVSVIDSIQEDAGAEPLQMYVVAYGFGRK